MYPKPKKQYDLLILSLVALFTVIAAGGYELYQNTTKPPQSSPIPAWYTQPLSPTLDTATLDKLQTRLFVSSQQIAAPTPTASPAATPKNGNRQTTIASPSAGSSTASATPKP